jgi:branched-chain amino acid transport system substrate-binding protein
MRGHILRGHGSTAAIALSAVAAVAVVAMAGCGGGSSSPSISAPRASIHPHGRCAVSVGFEGPITGPAPMLGSEQLHFAQLAVSRDNAANHTHISLMEGDTQLMSAPAISVTRQFISNPRIVAVVGPAGDLEVAAVGPLLGRARIAFISGSATQARLTRGRNRTFFRVVPKDSVQGPQDARYIIRRLHPKSLMIIDDQTSYSTGLVASMTPVFRAARIRVDHQSVDQKTTDFSSLARKVKRSTLVVLPWQVALGAQNFGRKLAGLRKKALIFGTDGLFAPGTFAMRGSYVSSFAPDVTRIHADASIAAAARKRYGSFDTFGPPAFAAERVIDQAIASVCKARRRPTRSRVLAAVRKTHERRSILGRPIRFNAHGDLVNGSYFLFRVNRKGEFKPVPWR